MWLKKPRNVLKLTFAYVAQVPIHFPSNSLRKGSRSCLPSRSQARVSTCPKLPQGRRLPLTRGLVPATGAGSDGVEEIKRHPFFATVDWNVSRAGAPCTRIRDPNTHASGAPYTHVRGPNAHGPGPQYTRVRGPPAGSVSGSLGLHPPSHTDPPGKPEDRLGGRGRVASWAWGGSWAGCSGGWVVPWSAAGREGSPGPPLQ